MISKAILNILYTILCIYMIINAIILLIIALDNILWIQIMCEILIPLYLFATTICCLVALECKPIPDLIKCHLILIVITMVITMICTATVCICLIVLVGGTTSTVITIVLLVCNFTGIVLFMLVANFVDISDTNTNTASELQEEL